MGHNMYRHPLLVLLNVLSSLVVALGVGAVYINLSKLPFEHIALHYDLDTYGDQMCEFLCCF